MPTNKVKNRTFKDLLKANARYEIPFFQRGYAWERRQWKKLFEDLEDEIISGLEYSDFENLEHFFGPIVVLQKKFDHNTMKKFLVIDGQQRITTVYILLGLIRNLLQDKAHLSQEAQTYISNLNKYLINEIEDDDNDDYLRLKVFSTKGDRLPTYKIIFGSNPDSPYLQEDTLLYDPKTNKIDELTKFVLKKLKRYDVPQLWNICQALLVSLKIVWIPLDEEKDDAQAIFESLNDAGMPLSASELLCNYIFRPLAKDDKNEHEKLHNEKWLVARKRVGQNKFEDYLRDLFSIGEKKRIGKARKMYVHYKVNNRKLDSESAKSTLNQILNYADIYNKVSVPIQYPHKDSEIHTLLIKIQQTNMSSINPFLMAILKAIDSETLSLVEARGILNETYVLLVRRKISKLSVTKYDTFFPPLLGHLINKSDKVEAFQLIMKKEQLWIDDAVFIDALIKKDLYNQRELPFTRHVLQEVDKAMHKYKELPDYTTINTVEHILPQTLDSQWTEYLGEDATNINLPTIVDTIGNLSLNSRNANSTFGQKPFEEKKSLYSSSSALAKDIKNRSGVWNIEAIQNRSKDLAKIAINVWSWK